MPNDEDPFKDQPRRWVGRQCEFDHPDGKIGRTAGTVISHQWSGRTARGSIPDYELTIEGRSGRRIVVSMVESKALFT